MKTLMIGSDATKIMRQLSVDRGEKSILSVTGMEWVVTTMSGTTVTGTKNVGHKRRIGMLPSMIGLIVG